jgi:hypothetical protein
MKIAAWIIAVAAIAAVLPAHAQDRANQNLPSFGGQASGGPMSLLYVVSGVRDNGGPDNTGAAASFHCSNASTVSESLQFVVRNFDATVISTNTFTVSSGHTFSASTHNTFAFNEDAELSQGVNIQQGLVFIFASTQFMFCTAMDVDAAAAVPSGISLHMVRFSPVAGTVE